jgi:ABC-type transporter Mla subunit MlaD
MTAEISNDDEIVRNNISALGDLSQQTVEVISALENEDLGTVPEALKPFHDALQTVIDSTLPLARQLETQIRDYSRKLGQTAKDLSAIDQSLADTLNQVEQDALSANPVTPTGNPSSPSTTTAY